MSAQGHEARVSTIPACDFCKDSVHEDANTPAVYDGRTAYGWAYMCDKHWAEHGPGKTGLGIGQRLVLTPKRERDADCKAHA